MTKSRRASVLVLCLVLGALLSVAAGWACALWSHPDPGRVIDVSEPEAWAMWRRYGQEKWNADAVFATGSPGWGADIRTTGFEKNTGTLEVRVEQVVSEYRAGFPLRVFRGGLWGGAESVTSGLWPLPTDLPMGAKKGRLIPFHVIPSGLLIDSIFFAAILWLLFRGPWESRRRWREWRRRCGWCNYPFGDSAVCTECGKPKPTWTAGDAPPSSAR